MLFPPTPSYSCPSSFYQKPKKPPPPSKNIRKKRFLPSLMSQGVVISLWSYMHFYMPSVTTWFIKASESMSWPAETAMSLQIACFHLQIHRKWSRSQCRVSKLNVFFLSAHLLVVLPFTNSVAGTPYIYTYSYTIYIHIYSHISRADR